MFNAPSVFKVMCQVLNLQICHSQSLCTCCFRAFAPAGIGSLCVLTHTWMFLRSMLASPAPLAPWHFVQVFHFSEASLTSLRTTILTEPPDSRHFFLSQHLLLYNTKLNCFISFTWCLDSTSREGRQVFVFVLVFEFFTGVSLRLFLGVPHVYYLCGSQPSVW